MKAMKTQENTNSTYLSTNQINQIAGLIETVFTPNNKSTIKQLEAKFGIKFDGNRQNNLNKFWEYCTDELGKDNTKKIQTGQTLKEAVESNKKNGNFTYTIRDYVEAHIQKHYKKEYVFLSHFNTEEINQIISYWSSMSGIRIDLNFEELMNTNNYQKLLSSKYGVENVNKVYMNATNKIIDFIDNLTKDVINKNAVIYAITNYLSSGDKTELHNQLFNH